MTRILSSLFYISSMRKTSEEFNSETMIRNIWTLCGEEPTVDELPYWETINRYLERLEPEKLQDAINCLCHRLLRSRAFEDMRIRGKYWQIIIDGTQLCSSRRELDGKSLHRTHNKGTEKEYQENYYYVLEAKLTLHPNVLSIILWKWSPETYLMKERKLKQEEDFHYQFGAQAASLSRRMYKEHGVGLQELQVLKSIYLLYFEKERAVSKISPEQESLLEKTGVELSLC